MATDEAAKERTRQKKKEYRENHREEIREYNAKYKENHPEKIRQLNATYRERHRDEIRERHAKYREIHREELQKRAAIYRELNREQINARKMQRKMEDPEGYKLNMKERNAKHRRKKRWVERGNRILQELMKQEIGVCHVGKITQIREDTLYQLMVGTIYPSEEVKSRLALYFGMDVSELGFDDMPEELRKYGHDAGLNSAGVTAQRAYRFRVKTYKGPCPLLEDAMSEKIEKMLNAVADGMTLKRAHEKYGMDFSMYMLLRKMAFGGLSMGRHGLTVAEDMY